MNSKCENGSVWRLFLCSRLQELTSAQQAVCSRVNCGCYKKRVTAVNSTVSFRHRANRVRSPSSAKARRWPGAAIGIVRSRVTSVPAPSLQLSLSIRPCACLERVHPKRNPSRNIDEPSSLNRRVVKECGPSSIPFTWPSRRRRGNASGCKGCKAPWTPPRCTRSSTGSFAREASRHVRG